jgi:hypothetical protein
LKDDLFKKLTCQNKQSFDPEDKDYFQNLEKMEVVLNRKLNNRIQVYKNNKSIFNPIDLNELKKLKVNSLIFLLILKCFIIIIYF